MFTPLFANVIPNKLVPNVLNNMLRSPAFLSFAWFWIVSLTPFIKKPES